MISEFTGPHATLLLPRSASVPAIMLYTVFETTAQMSHGTDKPCNEEDDEEPMYVQHIARAELLCFL